MSRNVLTLTEKLEKQHQRECRLGHQEGYTQQSDYSYVQAPNGQSYYAASAEDAFLIGRGYLGSVPGLGG